MGQDQRTSQATDRTEAGCKEWNTFAEEPQAAVPKKTAAGSVRKDAPHPKTLSEIEVSQTARMTTGMGELDRVLGGGIVQGSLVLVGGAVLC